MSSDKFIIERIFEDVATEERLYTEDAATPIISTPGLLGARDLGVLEDLINLKAGHLGISPYSVLCSVEWHFEVAALKELPARLFPNAVTYLAEFEGCN